MKRLARKFKVLAESWDLHEATGAVTRQHKRLAVKELLRDSTGNPRLTSPEHDAKPAAESCVEPRWSKRNRVRTISRAAGNRVQLNEDGQPVQS